jgi:nucleoside-diphosphate-sugar epimerase
MHVAIAGGHGKIGRRLARRLHMRGDRVRGLIRNPDHADDVRADGAEPVVCDLERAEVADIAQAIDGCDAVVFAAGAGPGSGPERKWTMDRDGAVKLVRAASDAGVPRYVIVSSVGAEDPPDGDDTFSVYLQAKAEADRALVASGLEWTIVRPGMLTDDDGDDRVRIETTPVRAEVPRDDVASVLAAVLHEARSGGATLYVIDGDEPVDQALDAALS